MDPKIAQILHKIVSDPDNITEVKRHESEYYFKYKKHTFSILFGPDRTKEYGPYSFYLYPTAGDTTLSALIDYASNGEMEDDDMVAYHVADFNSENEKKLFKELFQVVKRKNSNIDKILNDILSD